MAKSVNHSFNVMNLLLKRVQVGEGIKNWFVKCKQLMAEPYLFISEPNLEPLEHCIWSSLWQLLIVSSFFILMIVTKVSVFDDVML